jgi:uncharacterized metal-binding protein
MKGLSIMSEEKTYTCSGGPTLIFACSGAADVGEIADRAARKLTKEGIGKMFCLAGVGGRIGGIMRTTESASKILAIDGCTLNCVKNCLEQAGFSKFIHLPIADIGLEKGKSPATEENISKVVAKGKEMLA